MTDQEQRWLDKARAGDRNAFGQLVEAYQRPVINLTYRMLGDPEEAADAAQEAFLRAYTRLHQYNPDHKFSTWLFSIANHHCIDRLRKRRITTMSIEDSPLAFNVDGESPHPEEYLLIKEQSAELQALLEQLEPEYRTPLILRYWHDLSYQEIADTMDISLAAVKSRLFRARQKLADCYEQYRATNAPVAAASRAKSNDQREIERPASVQHMILLLNS